MKHPAHAGELSHDDPRPGSEITWAPCLCDGLALDGMGVDHGGSDVAVTKPFLHGTTTAALHRESIVNSMVYETSLNSKNPSNFKELPEIVRL